MTDQPTPQTAQHCSGCKRHWCSGVDAQARTEALDVDALRRAMHIVLNSNRDAAWFVIGDDAPAYVAERIAIEYAAILAAKADR